MNELQQRVIKEFTTRYGSAPTFVVRAPGRVNLIGEHTDYNDGFVMPLAINRDTWIALRPRPDSQVHLFSMDHQENLEFDLKSIQRAAMSWREYPKGVANALQEAGYSLHGWEGVTACDVPMGAGLSSSASYELAVARAFCAVSGFPWDAPRMALIGQKAENEWVGVKCGIMDQMISAVGQAGKAVLIDCRSLAGTPAPLPAHTAVVILDTMTRRGLVDSAYNERRQQCQAAARHFGVTALRDVSLDQFNRRVAELEPLVGKRARHVITENQRTQDAVAAMGRGDSALLGQLMNASHDSLRDDFEVTNDALNIIVEEARATPGCLGARMTGAGFGGCAVALVEAQQAEAFTREVSDRYARRGGRTPTVYICKASAGASLETP